MLTLKFGVEVPFLLAVRIQYAPTLDRIVPTPPHPSNIFCLEKVFTVRIEKVPICFFGGD